MRNRIMLSFLPLLFFVSSVTVKENLNRKKYRGSYPKVFFKMSDFKNFEKSTGHTCAAGSFLKRYLNFLNDLFMVK